MSTDADNQRDPRRLGAALRLVLRRYMAVGGWCERRGVRPRTDRPLAPANASYRLAVRENRQRLTRC